LERINPELIKIKQIYLPPDAQSNYGSRATYCPVLTVTLPAEKSEMTKKSLSPFPFKAESILKTYELFVYKNICFIFPHMAQ
jgi:hypothetical protein